MKKVLAIVFTSVLALALTVVPAMAEVSPDRVLSTLDPGTSMKVRKTVEVPEILPVLDVLLLENETGSFADDIAALKAAAPGIWDTLEGKTEILRMGVAGFRDIPLCSWGSSGDWAYRRIQDLTTSRTAFLAGVDALTAGGGADWEESQYIALEQAVTGLGANYCGGKYIIPPGQGASWNPAAFRVIILATDAPFHNPGDAGCGDCALYPGPNNLSVIATLTTAGIIVIGIEDGGPLAQLHEVADATGGTVREVGASGAEIAEAIMDALGALTVDVTPHPMGCDPLQVTFNPAVREDVPVGSTVTFTEKIAVPKGTPDGTYCCHVEFRADGILIGTEQICIGVPSGVITVVEVLGGATSPPIVKCKWEQEPIDELESGDPTHGRPGTQILPPLEQKGIPVEYWAVCTDPEGVGTMDRVYVDVYHPADSPEKGSFKYELELIKVDKFEVGIPAFETAAEAGLIKYGPDHDYGSVSEQLRECLAEVWMVTGTLNYHQPAGEYRAVVTAWDQGNEASEPLENYFLYVPVCGIEIDFTAVDYGTVEATENKWIGGDKDMATPGKPTVKNVGNTDLKVTVHESDLYDEDGNPLGMTGEDWNVKYDARLGAEGVGTDVFFNPCEEVTLPDVLPLCNQEKIDFSIHVKKASPAKYTGRMILGCAIWPFEDP